ncbi:MAG TPA: hypothetical protein VHB79_30560 [Polyangiaceae bacterium]|nr:hypothetical protein [Polyangiaceae bacterium]
MENEQNAQTIFVTLTEAELSEAEPIADEQLQAALDKGAEERRLVEQVTRAPGSSAYVMFR